MFTLLIYLNITRKVVSITFKEGVP